MNKAWAIHSPLHNKLAESDRPVHAWYRFVLSFPPHLVREYFSRFGINENSYVLDPFCGTGTTLVEAKKNGVKSIGIEANPMAAFASSVKIDWLLNVDELVAWSNRIATEASTIWRRDGYELGSVKCQRVSEDRSLFGLRTLTNDGERLILQGSISPLPLHRCLTILDLIELAPSRIQGHLKLALAWVIVNEAGNIRFGPEVGITQPKPDARVAEIWLDQINRMAADLRQWSACGASSSVVFGDSRNAADIEPGSISAVFTSPPYPNEKDYTRTTRLESVLLGLINNKEQLRGFKETLLRSNTRNVFVNDTDDQHIKSNLEIQRIAEQIERRRLELGKTSGFERLYHRVTKLYFGGMARHFSEQRPFLKPGAMLGYVVGDQASYLRVMIRTSELLRGIAENLGYEYVSSDVFRTRLATATKEQLVEDVLVLRWPG
jgi:DNA modification methylase